MGRYKCKNNQTIINVCFEVGKVPNCLRLGFIKPLFTNGVKQKNENYRPISLLPAFSKIFEKLMKERFLHKFGILSVNQIEFREGLTAEDVILKLNLSGIR